MTKDKLDDSMKPEHIYVIIALIAGFLFYQAFVITPQKKLDAEQKVESAKELKYTSCIADAGIAYDTYWENNCSLKGLGHNCLLTTEVANQINSSFKEDKNRCVTLYK